MSNLIKTLNTIKGPQPIGPYSTVSIYNGLMYISGQLGIEPSSLELVSEDVEEQTRRAMENMKILFKETNCDFDHVIKTTVFLKVSLLLISPCPTSLKSTKSTVNISKCTILLGFASLSANYPKMPNLKSKLSLPSPPKDSYDHSIPNRLNYTLHLYYLITVSIFAVRSSLPSTLYMRNLQLNLFTFLGSACQRDCWQVSEARRGIRVASFIYKSWKMFSPTR
jgi:hypothetical protein